MDRMRTRTYVIISNIIIYRAITPASIIGQKNSRDGFYHLSTLDMYLLMCRAVSLPKDMVANGHSRWVFYRQPFSQYSHHLPSNMVWKFANLDQFQQFLARFKRNVRQSESKQMSAIFSVFLSEKCDDFCLFFFHKNV